MNNAEVKVIPSGVATKTGTRKGVPNKASFQAKQIAEEMGIDPFRVLTWPIQTPAEWVLIIENFLSTLFDCFFSFPVHSGSQ